MDSEFFFDSLESLAGRWDDLAGAFERLYDSLPRNTADPFKKKDWAGAVVFTNDAVTPLVREFGLGRRCSCEGDDGRGANPPPLPSDVADIADVKAKSKLKGAKQAIAANARRLRAKANTVPLPAAFNSQLKDLLTDVIDVYAKCQDGAFPPVDADTFIPDANLKTVTAKFEAAFATDPSGDTPEVATCRSKLKEFGEFIGRRLRSFYELLDGSFVADRFEQRSIRGSIDNLSAYPLLTADAGPRATPSNGGGGGGSGGLSVRRTVQAVVREVLGRDPRTSDPRSFLTSLTQCFQATVVNEQTMYRWVPRTYSGQTDLGGGVTGAQASLATRAQVAIAQALPLLDGLYSLREDADPQLLASTRSIIRSHLTEIVAELALEGGPRVARVDGLFELLLVQPFSTPASATLVEGHLGLLEAEMGLVAANVNTLDEESDLTNFVALSDYITSLNDSWRAYRDNDAGTDLGTQFVNLSRALSVAAESVDEVDEAMDSVFVGAAERQVATFVDPGSRRKVSVGDLLDWVRVFASDEAPGLVHDGGRRGAQAVVPIARRLSQLVDRLLASTEFDTDLPDGLRQPRVQNPLRELKGHLKRVEQLADGVKLTAT